MFIYFGVEDAVGTSFVPTFLDFIVLFIFLVCLVTVNSFRVPNSITVSNGSRTDANSRKNIKS